MKKIGHGQMNQILANVGSFGSMTRFILFATLAGPLVIPAFAQTSSTIGPQVEWSLAAAGDVIMNRRVAPFDQPGDPAFHNLANLVRSADAAFMNLEQSV